MGIPLKLEIVPADGIDTPDALLKLLRDGIDAGHDMLMCVRWADVIEVDSSVEPVEPSAGHIVVVDRVQGERVRIVDPARGRKWKEYNAADLYNAMDAYKDENAADVWILKDKGD